MMNYDTNSGLSASDVALLTGNNRNNDGFGDSSGWWIILLLLALGGWNNNGFGGGFGGSYGGGFNNDYAWLSNGQKEIMQNTNDGFNTLQLANQLTSVNSGIQNLSTQLCNCCADVNSNLCNGFAGVNATVNAGFAGAEQSANARQMANMQQAFSNQLSTLQGFNNLSSQFADCCCENRLANCQTQNIIQNEGNATRFADANNTRDIITNATSNTQAILDKLCQLELDGVKAQVEAKNDRIAELQSQLQMADLRASQTAQNAFISQGFANEVDALYNRLNNCPVPSTPVYGRTPIFTCNQNQGCGCGCGNNF
jgi:hypothetical protein